MKTIEIINRTREYLNYLEKHIVEVQKAWELVKSKCSEHPFLKEDGVIDYVSFLIKRHDYSKFSKEEFCQYRDYFYPAKGISKNEFEFEKAWKHHLEKTAHHWETFDKFENIGVAKLHALELVCDWIAMGKTTGKPALEYFKENYAEIMLPKEVEVLIVEILRMVENA